MKNKMPPNLQKWTTTQEYPLGTRFVDRLGKTWYYAHIEQKCPFGTLVFFDSGGTKMRTKAQITKLERELHDVRWDVNSLKECVKIILAKTETLRTEVQKIIDDRLKLQQKVECGAKTGHEFTYIHAIFSTTIIGNTFPTAFVYRCKWCNLEIKKSCSELTPKERNALIELGVLDRPRNKKEKKSKREKK
jgi:hypothetical protein